MEEHEGNNSSPIMHIHNVPPFKDQDIVLDFHEYKNCKFERCNMVFYGHGKVGLINCEFFECRWTFSGPASATLNFMAHLYKNGNGADKIIKETFQNILQGKYL